MHFIIPFFRGEGGGAVRGSGRHLFEVGRLKCTFWGWGGGGGGVLEAGAYKLILPSGWALIRGWALNRINTVSITTFA